MLAAGCTSICVLGEGGKRDKTLACTALITHSSARNEIHTHSIDVAISSSYVCAFCVSICLSVCDPALPIPITTWMSGPNLPPSGVRMNNTNANSSAQYVFAHLCVCASAKICARIPRIRAQIERVVQMRGTRWRTRVRKRACVCDWECIVHRVLESDTTCVACTFRMHDRPFARG